MRYEVKHVHPYNFGPEKWVVYDNTLHHAIFAENPPLLKSAAHIIAWALNNAANGDQLAYIRDHGFGDVSMVMYDGPTEGVRA